MIIIIIIDNKNDNDNWNNDNNNNDDEKDDDYLGILDYIGIKMVIMNCLGVLGVNYIENMVYYLPMRF